MLCGEICRVCERKSPNERRRCVELERRAASKEWVGVKWRHEQQISSSPPMPRVERIRMIFVPSGRNALKQITNKNRSIYPAHSPPPHRHLPIHVPPLRALFLLSFLFLFLLLFCFILFYFIYHNTASTTTSKTPGRA